MDPTIATQPPLTATSNTRSARHLKAPVTGHKVPDEPNSEGGFCKAICVPAHGHTVLSSSLPLHEWLGSLATFGGIKETRPNASFNALDWPTFTRKVCPEKPSVVREKHNATYFLTCALRDALLTGKTLEHAEQNGEPKVGKMRSKDHVTESNALVFDYDGIEEAVFERIRSFLEEHKLTYIAYTTFSHGREDKPGMHVRVCIPVDRPLDADAYTAAWNGFVALLPVAADSSGSKLCQQQGIWTCHPDRKDKAQRWSYDGGVLGIDALPRRPDQGDSEPSDSSSQETLPSKTEMAHAIQNYPPSDANRVAERCNQIRLFRDTKGANQKEPLWFDSLGVVGRCKAGRKNSHEWSSGHPGYSKAETDRKLDLLLQFGPTTCEQFRKTNPSGCEGCSENVKSPIVLGYEKEEFTPEPMIIGQKPVSLQNTDTKAPSSSNEASTATSDAGKTPFPIIEPSKEPADPAKVLDAVHSQVCQYIVADFQLKIAITLWIVMTWFIDRISVAPLLLITAAERESGKSQLLSLIGRMCARPLTVSNMTMAFIFRAITKWRPTMLIDEVDTFLRENAEQRGLINAGHTRGSAYVGRVSGDEHEPTMYDVWSAKALAGIALEKHLTDATMSRGIVISLRRKLKGETVGRLRHADQVAMNRIASELARFEQDYGDQVSQARPTLPDALSDRQQDNWEPLFAIAACAGPEWLARCEEAALALSRAADLAEDTGNSLLGDIRDIFHAKKCAKISSADLIEALITIADAGWSTYNRGRALTPRQVANFLKPYGIIPKTVRLDSSTPKGYDRAQFEDAFKRYLPELAIPEPEPVATPTPGPKAAPDTPPDDPEFAF